MGNERTRRIRLERGAKRIMIWFILLVYKIRPTCFFSLVILILFRLLEVRFWVYRIV